MYKNILIVKLSAIGDVIHALPVALVLKTRYPNSRITWIVEKPAYDLLTDNPYIDEIILFDKPKFKSWTGLIKSAGELSRQLKSRKFDLAIDLQGLFKSAAIAWLSGAPKRLVYCNARELSHLVSERVCGEYSNGHVVDRYLDVPRHLGCRIDKVEFPIVFTPQDIAKTEAIAGHAGLDMRQNYIVLAPGTNWATKCWPTTHFAELADAIYEQKIIPVVVGGANDKRLFEDIAAKMRIPPVNLTGQTSLKQLAYIIKKSKAFVGGDTGPMHLAAAVNTPVIALFGPTDPARNGPYGNQHRVISASVPCAGCWRRTCDKSCMDKITPSGVLQAVQEVLSGR